MVESDHSHPSSPQVRLCNVIAMGGVWNVMGAFQLKRVVRVWMWMVGKGDGGGGMLMWIDRIDFEG
jgi:hypothetical protein